MLIGILQSAGARFSCEHDSYPEALRVASSTHQRSPFSVELTSRNPLRAVEMVIMTGAPDVARARRLKG